MEEKLIKISDEAIETQRLDRMNELEAFLDGITSVKKAVVDEDLVEELDILETKYKKEYKQLGGEDLWI